MQHIFSSGELLYKENIKELTEGRLIADSLVYDEIDEDTEFICLGKIHDRKVKVRFVLAPSGTETVLFKKRLNILMQSDILNSEWQNYAIE